MRIKGGRVGLMDCTPLGQNIHRRRFPEKQQHLRYRDLGCVKNSGITAHTPRANTAETSGRNARPALPCHVKRSSYLTIM